MNLAEIRDLLRDLQYQVEQQRKAVGRGDGGRELALVQTKLDEARLWLYEVIEMLAEAE